MHGYLIEVLWEIFALLMLFGGAALVGLLIHAIMDD